MNQQTRYSYTYSFRYGGLTLRKRVGEYVDEVFMQGEEAEDLHDYLERLRTDKKVQSAIEPYFD